MAALVHQCPHVGCLTDRVAFEVWNISYAQGTKADLVRNFVHASCRACGQPAAFELTEGTGRGRLEPNAWLFPGSLSQLGWKIAKVWPEPPKPRVPDHLPENVAKAYLAAERNFVQEKMEEASAASYGRALDLGTKEYAPELSKLSLYDRIKRLADEHRITSELADWAHAIRKIRNGALHDVDDVTRDELIAIRGFTETVMTYLFTLPGMLKARQADTSEKPVDV